MQTNIQHSTANVQRAARTDWVRVAGTMREALERAVMTGRARTLALWAVKPTLMRGRTRVVIPNRARLCELLNIGQNHVGAVIKELDDLNIAWVKAVADGWEILVFPDATGWRCQFKHSREQMAAFLAALENAPGQCQGELLEPEPSLRGALAETSAESASSHFGKSAAGAVPVLGSSRAVPVNCENCIPIKQSTREQLNGTVHVVTALDKGGELSREREAEVMQQLRRFVGDADVDQWGGDWRKNWLRKYPAAFQSALATLHEESKTGWKAKISRQAALKDLTLRYSGNVEVCESAGREKASASGKAQCAPSDSQH